jgi:hypothetical protein
MRANTKRTDGLNPDLNPTGDSTLALMIEYVAPLTREAYLQFNNMGVAYEPGPEEEAEMPIIFQRCYNCGWDAASCTCVLRGVAEVCDCESCSARAELL